MASALQLTPYVAPLKPFWRYYGGKWRLAPHYPKPAHDTIVEPFAGAAGYACRYPDRKVILVEKYPVVAEMWRYLIAVRAEEVLRIPLVESVAELPDWVPEGARSLVGFTLNAAVTAPCNVLSSGRKKLRALGRRFEGWSEAQRARVARQVASIRHWQLIEGDYTAAPGIDATWFIDPPYNNTAGSYYIHSALDYAALGSWCQERRGQVMVCENAGADWLPFEPFQLAKAFGDRQVSDEVLWLSDGQATKSRTFCGGEVRVLGVDRSLVEREAPLRRHRDTRLELFVPPRHETRVIDPKNLPRHDAEDTAPRRAPQGMPWRLSDRADPVARQLADRHYNRQKIGATQFVPPGRCLVLMGEDGAALWITSYPFSEYVKHRWAGAWVCSAFRNEGAFLSSALIMAALAATAATWAPPSIPSWIIVKRQHDRTLVERAEISMVTFIDESKTAHKRDPGRCYRRAGFEEAGRTKGGLVALVLRSERVPVAREPLRVQGTLAGVM